MVPFDFGLRLKKMREDKHLSQADAAQRIGVSKNTVYRYENNLQEPTRENLVKLARLYNTTVDFLVGLSSREPFVIYGLTKQQQQVMQDFVTFFLENRGL